GASGYAVRVLSCLPNNLTPEQPDTLSHGAVAQMGERRPCKAEVVGSIPISSTRRAGCTLRNRGLRSVDPARCGGSAGFEFFDNCIRVKPVFLRKRIW